MNNLTYAENTTWLAVIKEDLQETIINKIESEISDLIENIKITKIISIKCLKTSNVNNKKMELVDSLPPFSSRIAKDKQCVE